MTILNLYKSIKSKLAEANVLSIGIFTEHPEFDVTKENLNNLKSTFNSRKVRFKKKLIHSYANPFLFVEKDELYLFSEVQDFFYIEIRKSIVILQFFFNLGLIRPLGRFYKLGNFHTYLLLENLLFGKKSLQLDDLSLHRVR